MDETSWTAYATPPSSVREHGLACLGAGEHRTTASFRGRTLASFAMVHISQGRGWYAHRGAFGGERAVRAPSLMWVVPGREHGYGPEAGGWMEHWVLFAGVGVQSFVDLGVFDPAMPVVELDATPERFPDLFASLRTALGTVGFARSLEASVLTQQLLLASSSSGHEPLPADARLISRLRSSAKVPMSMADRARTLGVSLDTLRQVVKDSTGLTPVEFVLEARISRAQNLLAETSLDVREISGRVGYEDPAYFARVFASRVGVPPTAFREQQWRHPAPGAEAAASD